MSSSFSSLSSSSSSSIISNKTFHDVIGGKPNGVTSIVTSIVSPSAALSKLNFNQGLTTPTGDEPSVGAKCLSFPEGWESGFSQVSTRSLGRLRFTPCFVMPDQTVEITADLDIQSAKAVLHEDASFDVTTQAHTRQQLQQQQTSQKSQSPNLKRKHRVSRPNSIAVSSFKLDLSGAGTAHPPPPRSSRRNVSALDSVRKTATAAEVRPGCRRRSVHLRSSSHAGKKSKLRRISGKHVLPDFYRNFRRIRRKLMPKYL